jgi:hypothetical protein
MLLITSLFVLVAYSVAVPKPFDFDLVALIVKAGQQHKFANGTANPLNVTVD